MKKRKTKKKRTAAQKAAFNKMIKALHSKKRGKLSSTKRAKIRKVSRQVPAKLEPLIIMEGRQNMKRRKHSKRRKSVFSGIATPRKRKHAKRRFYGADRGGKVSIRSVTKSAVPMITDAAAGVAGAIAGNYVGNMLSFIPKNFKAITPIALAIALATFGKKIPFSRPAANGMMIIGTYGLLKSLVPNLPPLLAGEDVMLGISEEQAAMLGYTPNLDNNLNGFQENLSGAFVSPADIS